MYKKYTLWDELFSLASDGWGMLVNNYFVI